MPAALTPSLGLHYLRALSADIEAAVVLDGAGERLAGARSLVAPARALLAAAGDATEIEAVTPGGGVVAARDSRHAIVIVTGRQVLPGLARHDLRTVLDRLGASAGPEEGSRDGAPAAEKRVAQGAPDAVAALLAAASNPTLT
jgi:hypothetical protein